MSKYIQCPEVYNFVQDSGENAIFIGGGISGCEVWQDRFVDMIKEIDAVIINPRRKDFDINNPEMAKEQIKWEYDHLRLTNAKVFWFSPETLCPITLYEYGYWLAAHLSCGDLYSVEPSIVEPHKLFVGVHPDYKRRLDVLEQTRLVLEATQEQDPIFRVEPVDSLEELAKQVIDHFGNYKPSWDYGSPVFARTDL